MLLKIRMIMKISTKDAFDLNLFVRGMGNQLTYMHNDIIDYMYHMTVRGGQKVSREELLDMDRRGLFNSKVYRQSADRNVRICASIDCKIREYKSKLCYRWGIDELEDLQDDYIIVEAKRFSPKLLRFKKSNNYLRVRVFYGKVLTGFVDCLYTYVCAATAQSYKIPLLRKKQFELCNRYDLRFHNDSEDIVRFINTLIDEIMDDVIAYEDMVNRTISMMGGWDR